MLWTSVDDITTIETRQLLSVSPLLLNLAKGLRINRYVVKFYFKGFGLDFDDNTL